MRRVQARDAAALRDHSKIAAFLETRGHLFKAARPLPALDSTLWHVRCRLPERTGRTQVEPLLQEAPVGPECVTQCIMRHAVD
jgi:hypothetical protein